MIVYLVFESWHYSEEDHDSVVLRVFSSKNDADSFCASLIDSKNDNSYDYYVVPYEVF